MNSTSKNLLTDTLVNSQLRVDTFPGFTYELETKLNYFSSYITKTCTARTSKAVLRCLIIIGTSISSKRSVWLMKKEARLYNLLNYTYLYDWMSQPCVKTSDIVFGVFKLTEIYTYFRNTLRYTYYKNINSNILNNNTKAHLRIQFCCERMIDRFTALTRSLKEPWNFVWEVVSQINNHTKTHVFSLRCRI